MNPTLSICRSISHCAFLGVAALAGLTAVASAAEPRVTFPDSLKATAAPHALTAAHLADRVGFNIPLPLRNQAELEARVNSGEVLSGAELHEKYFPLQSDYDSVAAWLKGEGFAVDAVADTNLAVFAHGTVAQVQNSFQTTMGLITAQGAEQPVAQTAPSLPASIASRALGFSGLSYRRPRSRLVRHTGATPKAVPSGGYHIADIRKAYGGNTLTVNGTALDGSGQTIGIEAYLFPKTADLTAFWTANGITRKGAVTNVNVNNGTLATDADNLGETELDVEWASGIAPGANIVVYATNENNNDDAERIYARAVTDATASGSTLHVFSSSYGPTEAALTTTEKNAYNNYFLSMTAAGLTYLNASGDIGSGDGSTLTPEAYGDCPYATGVGGTNLQVNVTTGVRTSEVVWGRDPGASTSGSSGGLSKFFAKPAWQTGTGTPTGAFRGIPDLALAADYLNSPAYYYTNGSAGEVGGTSWSAPTFAGFLAMIQQGRALNTPARGALGFINPRLYALIGTANFYDVTSGNNGAYTATAGYDLCTGVGVPTVNNLLATWLGPAITSFTPASGAAGTSVVITGKNFYSNTGYPVSVTFNGTAAASVTVNSATQITAVAPAGVTAGSIVVTTFGDAATSATNFSLAVADLTVTSTHSGNFTQADSADAFTLTVTNSGAGASSGTVTVTDTLPAGLTATALAGTGWTAAANHLSATRADALASGGSYPALTLTVSVSSTAAASVTNTVTVSGGGESNTGNDSSSDQTAIIALTPTQSWRYQYFGTTANAGNAADSANPAGDGIPNLTKYALGLNPLTAAASPIAESITSDGHLELSAPKNPNATDITYAVQVTGDLSDASSWSSDGVTIVTNSSTLLQAYDGAATTAAGRRFIRLQISR